MRVLFVGGTGIISSACARAALERGIDLYLLHRGKTTRRAAPDGARLIQADIGDRQSVERALGDLTFDAVANFVAFTPDQVERDQSGNRSAGIFEEALSGHGVTPRPSVTAR